MKKKSIFVFSSVILAGIATSCGGFKTISADDAKAKAKAFDERLSDLVMKDSRVNFHVNKLNLTGVNGVLAYTRVDSPSNVIACDITNGSFTQESQDVVNISVGNSLLNDVNNAIPSKDAETFLNIGYILSATVSEEMIDYLNGTISSISHAKNWEHLKVNFYSKSTDKGNDTLMFDVNVDNLNDLYKEMKDAGMPDLNEFFKFVGNGSLYAKVTCDDYGYISNFALQVTGEDITYSQDSEKIPEKHSGSLPSISDILYKNVDIEGFEFKGKAEIDVSLDITHNEAKQYSVSFQRTNVIEDTTEGSIGWKKEGASSTITDLGTHDESKATGTDDVLEFNDYSPIKYDSVREVSIYGPRNVAFEDMGYALRFRIKSDKATEYKYILAEGEDPVDIETLHGTYDEDTEESYPYANVSVNGIGITPKVKEESKGISLTSDYCYFNVEQDPKNDESNEYYLCLHIGKDTLRKAAKLTSGELKILVNVNVWHNETK